MKIDFTARKVFIDDKEVEMSPKEYVLLFYLVRNEGIALTREQLIHDVWGMISMGMTERWIRISSC